MSVWVIYKKSWKEVVFILFVLGFCGLCKCWKLFSKVFSRNILGIVRDLVKFTFNFFRWEICRKNHVHDPHHAHWNIFHKRMTILNHIFVCWIWLRWFLVNSWIHEPNAKTKGFWTLNSQCQEKLYFNKIVSIKSKFFANWVIGRT